MSRPVACPLETAVALGSIWRQEGRGLRGLWGRCRHLENRMHYHSSKGLALKVSWEGARQKPKETLRCWSPRV